MATTEQPSIAGHRGKGLRRLSPDQIGKAINETEKQINTIMLAFIGAAAFCVLSLLTPDSALLGGSDKVNVPLAGPVSFVGFIIIGPAVLIVLRVYLEIYIEHGKRLARVARLVPAKRDPTLLSSQNAFLRVAFALALGLLLPLTLLMFAWKAAVFPVWGAGLLCVVAAVIAGHAMLRLPRFSWRSRVFAGAMLGFGPPRRSFELFRANLSGQWLASDDLRDASLSDANLNNAFLGDANLSRAFLGNANLSGAVLFRANLSHVILAYAHLNGTDLSEADLSGAREHGLRHGGEAAAGPDPEALPWPGGAPLICVALTDLYYRPIGGGKAVRTERNPHIAERVVPVHHNIEYALPRW